MIKNELVVIIDDTFVLAQDKKTLHAGMSLLRERWQTGQDCFFISFVAQGEQASMCPHGRNTTQRSDVLQKRHTSRSRSSSFLY